MYLRQLGKSLITNCDDRLAQVITTQTQIKVDQFRGFCQFIDWHGQIDVAISRVKAQYWGIEQFFKLSELLDRD